MKKSPETSSKTKQSGVGNLRAFLEWDRLYDFFRIKPFYTGLYIIVSIVADLAILVAPALVVLSVSMLVQAQPKADYISFIEPILAPQYALPIAFVAVFISQALGFWRLVIIRRLDRLFFQSESNSVLQRYKDVSHYHSETGQYVHRAWFGKNISRNVRHTSEAMQAQLKLIPDSLTLFFVLSLLASNDWILGLCTIGAMSITSVLLISQSSKVYSQSKEHFSKALPAFASTASQLLKKVYFLSREIELKADLEPQFQDFLDSRYRLYIKRGYLTALSTIIISGTLLVIIYLAIYFGSQTNTGLDPQELFISVILLLQIMNKGRAILGGLGGIMTYYPQIKMARDIELSLEASKSLEEDRAKKSRPRAIGQLPYLVKLKGNGRLTRFNFIYAIELIEREICKGQIIPEAHAIRLALNTAAEHANFLDIQFSEDELMIDTLITAWRTQGKLLFFVDWKLFNEMTYPDFEKFIKKHRRIKIVLATHANIPPRWLKLIAHSYKEVEWEDPTLSLHTSALEDSLSGEEDDL